MNRRLVSRLLACALALLVTAPAGAAVRLADVKGHIGLGYAHLFTDASPGGSLSAGAGVDIPIASGLRAGLDLGYHLLGTRSLEQGSLTSSLDYSLLEALALVHWSAPGSALSLSAGPGLFIAQADLPSSAVGAAFTSQTVNETRLGGAVGLSLAKRTASPVRAGIEAGVRVVPLSDQIDPATGGTKSRTWTVAIVRLRLLY
jgi:hypothetical protein